MRYKNTKYLISVDGIVTNEKTNRTLKTFSNGNGYQKLTLTINGVQSQRYLHRLVAELYINNPDNRKQVNHKNGIKSDNRAINLEWCTNSENQIHAHRTGLKSNGGELWNGKFNSSDIKKIFKLKKQGMKQYLVAEEMNCSPSTISEIINGKRYKIYTSH
jgi:predicted P-loop ATPase